MRISKWIIGTALTSLAFAPFALSQAGFQAAPQTASALPAFTHPQTVNADIAELDYTLNHTLSFSGRFTQFAPDGTVTSTAEFVDDERFPRAPLPRSVAALLRGELTHEQFDAIVARRAAAAG